MTRPSVSLTDSRLATSSPCQSSRTSALPSAGGRTSARSTTVPSMEGGTYSQPILEEFLQLANENLKVQTTELYEMTVQWHALSTF